MVYNIKSISIKIPCLCIFCSSREDAIMSVHQISPYKRINQHFNNEGFTGLKYINQLK